MNTLLILGIIFCLVGLAIFLIWYFLGYEKYDSNFPVWYWLLAVGGITLFLIGIVFFLFYLMEIKEKETIKIKVPLAYCNTKPVSSSEEGE